MGFLLGNNRESSLTEDILILLVYGLANYWRDKGLASSGKEPSQKSESGSDYRTNKKGSSIRRQFIIPSEQSNGSNNNGSQDTTPKKQRFCCPSCGARLRLNLSLSQSNLGFIVQTDSFNNLRQDFLPFVRCNELIKSRVFIYRFLRFIHSKIKSIIGLQQNVREPNNTRRKRKRNGNRASIKSSGPISEKRGKQCQQKILA